MDGIGSTHMIDIILIEPKTQKNLGAAARSMKNFGFSNLVLIDPKCKIGIEARKVAKHAQEILKKAKTKDKKYLKRYDCLIGTTAILGRAYNLPRNPMTPKECAQKIAQVNPKTKIGLIIGRENSGLTNEEIEQCDMLVHIPASKIYPTMNVSHALSIFLYEFFIAMNAEHTSSHIVQASSKEKDVLLKYIDDVIDVTDFQTPEKKETQRKVWKRIVGKALLTKKEAYAIMGFFLQLIRK